MANILIIDGQGGGIGKQLVAALKEKDDGFTITAVGTNAIATSAMAKAGADKYATGENSVKILCLNADVIAGPMGIVMPNAMLGEVTPAMAEALSLSRAKKILIPVSKCSTYITLSARDSLFEHIQDAVNKITEILT